MAYIHTSYNDNMRYIRQNEKMSSKAANKRNAKITFELFEVQSPRYHKNYAISCEHFTPLILQNKTKAITFRDILKI